jgi:hypothetical protein
MEEAVAGLYMVLLGLIHKVHEEDNFSASISPGE